MRSPAMVMQPVALLLALLLALTAERAGSASWDEERLQWLVVTKPGERQVQLNCTSEHIYPFTLLNDSSIIGALGSRVKRVWWILPDGRLANASYDDGNRRAVDGGVGLLTREVTEGVHGLYHCAVEANTMINETQVDLNSTKVYYYKRGLNLYGPDLYGGNIWEKYKRNTLIGSLTAGIFLAFIAGYALLDRLGVFARCAGSNAVDSLGPTAASSGVAEAAVAEAAVAEAAVAAAAEAEAAEMKATPKHSRVSIRSRQSLRAQAEAADTAA